MNSRVFILILCALCSLTASAQQPLDNRPLLRVVDPANLIFAVSGPEDTRYVLETSASLVQWLPVETNLLYGFGEDLANWFIPEMFPGGPFYRARQFRYPIVNDVPHADDCAPLGPPDDPAIRNAAIPSSSTPIRMLRLLFHIVAPDDGLPPNPSPDVVEAQVLRLNRQFFTTHIQFTHQTRVLRSTRLARPQSDSDLLDLRRLYSESPATQLNVFITTMPGGDHGRSTYPWTTNALGQGTAITSDGGIVTSRIQVGPTSAVLAHEIGHALGLWHTTHGADIAELSPCHVCWERPDFAGTRGADLSGDRCSDTPAGPIDDLRNPIGGIDPCSGRPWPVAGLRNPMSSQPSVEDYFTPQQAGRMHAWINHTLSNWLDHTTPAAPFDLIATATPFGEVLVTWSDNSWNETDFAIERTNNAGGFAQIATVPANTTAFTDLTAPASTVVHYRVRAFNGGTASDYSDIAAVRTPSAPVDFIVDGRNTTMPFRGTEADPFQTVAQAFAEPPTGHARRITVQSGTYRTTFPANPPPSLLTPRGGTVIFEKP